MGFFETRIPGDVNAVLGCADWMRTLSDGLSEAASNTRAIRSRSAEIWQGEAGDAYRALNKAVVQALGANVQHVDRVHDLLLAYAQQLRWRQEDMDECRRKASEAGLPVNGTAVMEPQPVACPVPLGPNPSPQQAHDHQVLTQAHDRYIAQSRAYLDLQGEAAHILQKLDDWTELNLRPALSDAASWVTRIGTALTVSSSVSGGGKSGLETRADQFRERARERSVASARKASGNPAIRAGVTGTQPRASAVEKRITADPATREAKSLSKVAGALNRIGEVTTVAGASLKIYQGVSPSTVAVGILGGLAGGAAGADIGSGFGMLVGGPPGAVVGSIAGGITGTAAGDPAARTMYTHSVPRHVRELIDEGLTDGWNALTHPDTTHIVSDIPQGGEGR